MAAMACSSDSASMVDDIWDRMWTGQVAVLEAVLARPRVIVTRRVLP